MSTGHIDWCTFEDCEDAVVLRVNSRGNLDGCIFNRNTRAIRQDGSSHAFISPNTAFGSGLDANNYNIVRASGSQITSLNIIENVDVSRAITDSSFDLEFKNQTIASTTNTVFHTVNLLAPLWRNTTSAIALGKKLYFRIFGTLNGVNGNKRIYARLGTAVLTCTFGASDSGSFEGYGYIYFTGANQQYMFMRSEIHLGTPKQSRTIGSNEMSTNTSLTFEAQVDNASDSVLIDLIEVGWAG
jgi:hypothetical protein